MADPLSISASIAGLVSLADIVFLRLTKYIKSVKNAEAEINDLCKEVNLLGGAVSMLSRLARGHEMEDEPFNKDFRMYHIEGCAFILNEICEKTRKYDTTPKGKLLRLMWPYTSSKTKELLANLSRHKENINLALTANSMEALLRCLAKDEDRAKAIAEIQADVQKTREIVARIQEDSHQKEVLRFFLPYNPQPNYEMSVKLRHPMTGMWLERLPSFQTWLSSPSSRLWLSGIPGAGKTVLAGSIIGQALLRCSDTVAAGFFFCDYKNELTQAPASVLGALAHQIARQNEQAYLMLEEYYSELHPEKGLPRSPDPGDLAGVIFRMAQAFDQVYLIIDGLDECQDSTDEVVRALCTIAESSDEISMAILSRHEDNIRDSLQNPKTSFDHIQIAAHKDDITEYVTSEIQQRMRNKRLHLGDLSLQGEILEGLVDGANGMFRWVACQLDHLESCMSDEQCREALRSLPPTLPETYLRILRRIPKAQQSRVQLTLDFIAFADPKISIAQLREVLSVLTTDTLFKPSMLIREDAITRTCSSLVRKSNDGKYLEFAHFSVKEFLISEFLQAEFQMFSISKNRCDRVLATRCLKFLQLENFHYLPAPTSEGISTIEQTALDHPFYRYAAHNWMHLARGEWSDSALLAAAKRLFDPSKTPCFTHWAVFLVFQLRGWTKRLKQWEMMELIREIIDESFRPLHFAATLSLPEISSALLMDIGFQDAEALFEKAFECAVNVLQGALQRYVSQSRRLEIPEHLVRHIGVPGFEACYTMDTIQTLIEYFKRLPDNIVGFSIPCWARAGDFFVPGLLVEESQTLAQSDLDRFSAEMQQIINDYDPEDSYSMPLLDFCESLNLLIDRSALHFEFCRLVWGYILKVHGTATSFTNRINPRITQDVSSVEAFAISACRRLGGLDTLPKAVGDTLIDVSTIIDPDTGYGLLHTLVLADHDHYIELCDGSDSEWHHTVHEMLDILLGGGCNLSSRDDEGHTPLSLALEKQETRFAQILLKRPELESGAWESPVPILWLVAESGSQDILDQLLGRGFRPSPTDYQTKTPLHCLHPRATLEFATCFDRFFPCARTLSVDGQMPWEHYLEATNFDPPSADVLDFLIQPLLCHSDPAEGARIWEYCTSILLQSGSQADNQVYDQIITSFVQSGILGRYEEAKSHAGLLSMVPILSDFWEDEGTTCESPITDATMCLLIENTDHWATFQETPSAIQMLKLSASFHLDMAVTQLLERGIEVNRRHDGVSALEHVYQLPAADDRSILRIEKFLKYADSASLNQTNPTSGLGLIHVSNDMDEEQFRRKILELTIEAGASPNLRTASPIGDTGLTYHLDQKNFELACVLLEQGADPLIPSLHGWTAIHMAAARGAMPFMSRLLSPRESKWTIDWERRCNCVLDSEVLDNTSPLHLAAAESGDFLVLLLDKVPSINLEATAGNGVTALHWAAVSGNTNAIEALVSRGANVNARSADGRLALHIAVEKGNLGLVERLLELGSETTARSDGMTPLFLAYENNQQLIIDRLTAHAVQSSATAPVWDKVPSSALAKAVSQAVRAGNLSTCKSLLSRQSSIDIDVSEDGTGGFTPLAVAIRHGMLEIVEWLLEMGANANCHNGDGTSAIQDTLRKEYLNPILPTMLGQYLADGGSILTESNSLIYIAVEEANTGGLSILLNHLRANEKEYGERAGVARLAVIQLSVDMPCKGRPPLHMAIDRANRTAIRLLIDNGADIEATDSFNRTPLIYATQRLGGMDAFFIVDMLVRAGSNLNHRDSKGLGPLIGACKSRSSLLIIYLVRIGANLHTTDHVGSNCLHHLLDNCDETKTASIVPSTFLRLTGMLVDPYQANKSGWSAVHISMHRTSMTALLLNGDFQLTDLAPMSWSTIPNYHACPEAACLTSGFRLYCRKMSFERFRKLLNTEPADAWSPLCRAAAIGNTEAMKNLLSIGSLIDFEGCPEGSALMTASRAGILKSVKFLTRHGASISFQGREQHHSAVEASARSPKVLHWLLVDRFTDQFKLKWAPDVSDVSTENFKKWSGITKAEMVILGPWERRASESSRQYLSRLEQMKRDFNGKVVPPDQGAKTRRQSKLIPSEPVKIAAGGYNSTGENRQTLGI